MKVVRPDRPSTVHPDSFVSQGLAVGRELGGKHSITIQVAPDDCTGCGVCVDVCPAKSEGGR